MMKGRAQPELTAARAARNPELHYAEIGDTGLKVSQAGFGGYRIDVSSPLNGQALSLALDSGINLIDTSANYNNGGSEKLIGEVLRQKGGLFHSGRDTVVVTKGGYIQGFNYSLSQERKDQGRPFPDLVMFGEGLEHCIHPEFLEDQITRSLERLDLETIDVYLLHNPEYFLGWAHRTGASLPDARAEYYRRLSLAFEHLELETFRGRISCYGVSSNTFPLPADDPEFTSLEKIREIAESVSSTHHFRVVQFPLNLFESGAVTEINQSGGKTVLEFAAEKDLTVLTNRPLNPIIGRRLIRLADADPSGACGRDEITSLITDLILSESHLSEQLLPSLGFPASFNNSIMNNFSAGRTLMEKWETFESLARWQALQSQYFLPRIKEVLQFLATQEDMPPETPGWISSHLKKVEAVFAAIESIYRAARGRRSAAVGEMVSGLNKDWASAGTLSRTALRAVRSAPGVTSVLVGMRRPEYVEDVLAEISRPAVSAHYREAWSTLFLNRERFIEQQM